MHPEMEILRSGIGRRGFLRSISTSGAGRAVAAVRRMKAALPDALSDAGPPLLFGLRLWASVCLALFIAFSLELANAYWAGASAAIVCQPQLGASLRKGWFRMIGTLVGATMIVVLTAGFPQDRIAYLGLVALWCAICAFAATLLRNFASYAAALSGYTAAIIAADILGATGGPSTDVFMLAITRATEICIGIVSAGIVLAGTDRGGARRRLAATLADLAAEIMGRFVGTFAPGAQPSDTRAQRRELTRRVIALDPAVDRAIGESSELRYHSSLLHRALHGLFAALDGWRGVSAHLGRLPDAMAQREANAVLCNLAPELRSTSPAPRAPARWVADPVALRRVCDEGVHALLALPADSPSLRLLADETAKVLTGIGWVLDGLALLVDAPARPLSSRRRYKPHVPDWLPGLVNGGRAFVAIGAVQLFWVATAWPNGASAMTFTAILVLLLSPRGDLAYGGAVAFTLGAAATIVCAAVVKFAVLPELETFPAFCDAIALFIVPVGFLLARSRQPAILALVSAGAFGFMPLLAPANEMSYDTAQFYNAALAIFAGCTAASLSFRLIPPLSPAFRTRRLLALTLSDLRSLAVDPSPSRSDDWERRMYARLGALPDEATPLQRAQLMAALSVGGEIVRLRHMSPQLGVAAQLDATLAAIAKGRSATAVAWLHQLDHRLAAPAWPDTAIPLQARGRIVAISQALAEHPGYFDAGAPA
jgi:uncharacterized membrane protein YccC